MKLTKTEREQARNLLMQLDKINTTNLPDLEALDRLDLASGRTIDQVFIEVSLILRSWLKDDEK